MPYMSYMVEKAAVPSAFSLVFYMSYMLYMV